MTTVVGGSSCMDIARLRNDSTMTMRVKQVIVMTMAGAIDSSVIRMTISMAAPRLSGSVPPAARLRLTDGPPLCGACGMALLVAAEAGGPTSEGPAMPPASCGAPEGASGVDGRRVAPP